MNVVKLVLKLFLYHTPISTLASSKKSL